MVRHLDIRTFWQRDGRCSSSQRRLTPGPGAGPNAGLASIYIYRGLGCDIYATRLRFLFGGGTQLTDVTSSAREGVSEGGAMDWTVIERMWTQAKGRIQSKWDKLTREDLELIAGRRDRLETKIQHLYGFSPDHVRKEVDDWLRWQVLFGPRGQRQLGRSEVGTSKHQIIGDTLGEISGRALG